MVRSLFVICSFELRASQYRSGAKVNLLVPATLGCTPQSSG